MSKRHYELDTRVLTVFFIVAVPFVALGAFFAIHMTRMALQQSAGRAIEQRALETRQSVERWVEGRLLHVRQLALDAQVQAALASPPAPAGPDEQNRLDRAWAEDDLALSRAVVGSPLAARLRETTQLLPAFRLVQVVDARGRLVASSIRGGRLWNQQTPWFKQLSGEGAQSGFVGDVQRPANGATPMIELACPVRSGLGESVGAVRVLVDATALYDDVLAPVRMGSTGHALLVRGSDGLVLASDGSQRALRDHFAGFESIRAGNREGRGYWVVPEREEWVPSGAAAQPALLIGFSPVSALDGLDWMVALEQDLSEAMAPVKGITWQLMFHFAVVFGAALLLAGYLSFKLEKPVIGDDLHLHEEHVPEQWRDAPV